MSTTKKQTYKDMFEDIIHQVWIKWACNFLWDTDTDMIELWDYIKRKMEGEIENVLSNISKETITSTVVTKTLSIWTKEITLSDINSVDVVRVYIEKDWREVDIWIRTYTDVNTLHWQTTMTSNLPLVCAFNWDKIKFFPTASESLSIKVEYKSNSPQSIFDEWVDDNTKSPLTVREWEIVFHKVCELLYSWPFRDDNAMIYHQNLYNTLTWKVEKELVNWNNRHKTMKSINSSRLPNINTTR